MVLPRYVHNNRESYNATVLLLADRDCQSILGFDSPYVGVTVEIDKPCWQFLWVAYVVQAYVLNTLSISIT